MLFQSTAFAELCLKSFMYFLALSIFSTISEVLLFVFSAVFFSYGLLFAICKPCNGVYGVSAL